MALAVALGIWDTKPFLGLINGVQIESGGTFYHLELFLDYIKLTRCDFSTLSAGWDMVLLQLLTRIRASTRTRAGA